MQLVIYEDFGSRSRYLRQWLITASHSILWDAITYPYLRYLFLVPKSSYLHHHHHQQQQQQYHHVRQQRKLFSSLLVCLLVTIRKKNERINFQDRSDMIQGTIGNIFGMFQNAIWIEDFLWESVKIITEKTYEQIDGLVQDRRNSIVVILQERQKTVSRSYHNAYLQNSPLLYVFLPLKYKIIFICLSKFKNYIKYAQERIENCFLHVIWNAWCNQWLISSVLLKK